MSGESGGMNRTAILALCIAALPSAATAAERTLSVTSFDRVRIEGPFRVTVTTGVSPFAKIIGSASAFDSVTVDQQGRTLIVRPNSSNWGGYPGQSRGSVEVSVGTGDLSAAWVNGAGSLAINRVKGLSFNLAVQGSGSAAIGNASVDRLDVGLSGAGNATISGTVPKLTAIVRGSSSLDASGLAVKDATIGAEGPSQVRATASNSAKIDAKGVANVELSGGGACTVNTQGSATVTGC
jgi:hypothetical protein